MYSSEDLERFYFQYQTEALPHGEYLQSFCVKNNVLYDILKKCFRILAKNALHYGSDTGAEMTATYPSVIGTVKLHGSSVWNFIGTFFKNIFNECRDYVNMVPDKITLATSQC